MTAVSFFSRAHLKGGMISHCFGVYVPDTSLKDGLFHEYKKHGKVTVVKVIGQGTERYAVVCFKK